MGKKTRKAYEEYLNDFYEYQMSLDDAVDTLIYMQSKYWCTYVAQRKTMNTILSGKAGQLIRSLDPIAFNVGYNECNP